MLQMPFILVIYNKWINTPPGSEYELSKEDDNALLNFYLKNKLYELDSSSKK
jgi:hypothetical protein